MCGDVNGDGTVTGEDVELLAKYVAQGTDKLPECVKWRSNVNGDNAINVFDFTKIAGFLNGGDELTDCAAP